MKRVFFPILSALIVSAGCTRNTDTGDNRMLAVAVSIKPQHTLLKAITGDSVNIVTILPPNADPENFEPTVSAIKSLANSSIYFAIGNMPFESQLLEKTGISTSKEHSVYTAESIQTISGTHSHEADGRHDTLDPHVWTSIRNCRAIASIMLEALKTEDPERAGYYTRRYTKLISRLDSLDKTINAKLTECNGDILLTEHPSLSYFARDYGLNQVYFGAEHKEITPQRIQSVIDYVIAQKRPAIMITESEQNASRHSSVVKQTNATVAIVNTLGSDFLEQLDSLASKIQHNHKN